MMKAKDIVSKSVAAFVGTINTNKDLLRQIEYTKYNLSWLNDFPTIVYSLNGSEILVAEFIQTASSILKSNIKLLFSENLGPVFGAMDNDQKIFEYVAEIPDVDYIWKFSNDTIGSESMMEIDIDHSFDFFYINNIGYAALTNKTKDQLFEDIMSYQYFYPQTNYYIVKNQIKKWYPSKEKILLLKEQYLEAVKEHPEWQPWDAIQDCDCESMLAKTIKDNNLKPYHLLSDSDTKQIIDLVYQHKIHDGSHKNIMYTNVGDWCHYHVINHPVAPI
jgi:hypothetical protein